MAEKMDDLAFLGAAHKFGLRLCEASVAFVERYVRSLVAAVGKEEIERVIFDCARAISVKVPR
jgi:hypothetical protein